MTSQGYAIFQLDNRGSADRGRDFESPIYGHLGDIEVRDQLLGVQYLQSLDEIDSNRIGVFGHSYGGYMTLMLLMKSPGTFKCGISVAPVTDWGLYDTHYTERYLGLPGENPGGYERSSAVGYVDDIRGRLLLIHGMIDENVHFRHTARLVQAMVEAQKTYELLCFPKERHSPRSLKDRTYMEQRIASFLHRWLKGE